ncbi:MAG: hypothetical protein SF339_05690 [Blastocatellia bacterium]|nr:hypothetical protein [Blastocatellia bacterium]
MSATIEKLALYENFIFYSFPEFLLFSLKVPQLLADRFRRSQTPRARALDAELEMLSQSVSRNEGGLSLRQAEAALEQIAARLGEFRSVIAEIAIDRHTAQIDYQNAGDILRDHLPRDDGQAAQFLRPLKIYLEQAEKDLEYYRLALDAIVQTMDLVRLQTELLRVRFTNVLAAIGAGFGIFLGLGQLIDANYLKDFLLRRCPWFPLSPYGNSSRAAICLLLAGTASLIVYGLLNRFIATNSKAAGSHG